MGRAVRRVPPDWNHPRDARGNYIPLHEDFPYNESEIAAGLADGWLTNTPPHFGIDVMPDWPAEQRTHWQMYETTSEGTPISPVCASAEDLALWLADNGASAFAEQTATYSEWLATIRRGSTAASAISVNGEAFVSSVAMEYRLLGDPTGKAK